MEVKIITGTQQSAILREQINLIGAGLSAGKRQIVIVPDRFTVNMEYMILDQLKLKASFGIEVVSFVRLAHLIIPKEQSKEFLSKQASVMLTAALINKNNDKLKVFNRGGSLKFCEALHKTIAKLKGSKVSAEDLLRTAEKMPQGLLKNKLNDLAVIYQAYDDYLGERYIDSNARMDALTESIKTSPFFEGAHVHFCNFADFTAQECEVFKNAVKRNAPVFIGAVLPDIGQANTSAFYTGFYNTVKNIAKETGAKVNEASVRSGLTACPRFVSENLFSYPIASSAIKNDSYSVYSAGTMNREAEFVAQKIKQYVVSGGRFNEINVACADFDAYKNIFDEVFVRYGIPSFTDADTSLNKTEGFKFVLNALKTASNGFRLEDFLAYAKSVFSGADISEVNGLEIVLRAFGIEGNKLFIALTQSLPENFENSEKLEAVRKQLLQFLHPFSLNVKAAATYKDYLEAVRVFIEDLKLEDALAVRAKEYNDLNELFDESVTRQVYGKLTSLISQTEKILGDAKTTFNEFIEVFSAGAQSTAISPIPMSADCVFIGSAAASVFLNKPVLFIAGATTGLFPSYLQDADLLSDSELDKLRNSFNVDPSVRVQNNLIRQNALQLLLAGAKQVNISYPRTIGKEETAPSFVITQLAQAFNIKQINIEELINFAQTAGEPAARVFTLSNEKNTLLRFAYELRAHVDGIGQVPLDAGTLAAFLRGGGYTQELKFIISAAAGADRNLILKDAEEVFFRGGSVRVTELERYFDCPYRHFADYGLRLKENKTAKLSSLDMGSFLHRIAELFVGTFKEVLKTQSEEEKAARDIFARVVQENEFARFYQNEKNKNVFDGLKKESVRLIGAINYHNKNSAFKPAVVEGLFGEGGLAPLEIAVSGRKLKVTGKLDRADLCGKKYRVIDYKTGRAGSKFSLIDLYTGKKLQLFIYLKSLLNNAGKDYSAAGAYYMPVHNEFVPEQSKAKYSSYRLNGVSEGSLANLLDMDSQVSFEHPKSDIISFDISTSKENAANGELKPRQNNLHLDGKQFNAALDYALKIAARAACEIEQGFIEPKPFKHSCEYCPFSALCRIEVFHQLYGAKEESFAVDANTFCEVKHE